MIWGAADSLKGDGRTHRRSQGTISQLEKPRIEAPPAKIGTGEIEGITKLNQHVERLQ